MKVLITGAEGQLARALCGALEKRGQEYVGMSHGEMDVADETAVRESFARHRPQTVIHCASFNQVDLAEDCPERCIRVNVTGTRVVARECERIGAQLLFISSDYVFDGTKRGPYETDDPKNPLSVYGKSKSDAEDIVLGASDANAVLRTSWLFGRSQHNFVEAILRSAGARACIDVVDDQVGSPTYTEDLAALIAEMADRRCAGIYHGTNEGQCSRAQFAERILACAGLLTAVRHVSSGQYPSKAARPHNSVLSKRCLDTAGLFRLPPWEDALARYINTRENTREVR